MQDWWEWLCVCVSDTVRHGSVEDVLNAHREASVCIGAAQTECFPSHADAFGVADLGATRSVFTAVHYAAAPLFAAMLLAVLTMRPGGPARLWSQSAANKARKSNFEP